MNNLEPELTEVIEAIWGSTLHMGVERSECSHATECLDDSISAQIDILGETPSLLVLECSEKMASAAARCMFGLEQEDLAPRDLADAVGELVNILGGNIRCLISEDATIGIPVEHHSGDPGTSSDATTDSFHYESSGMPFHISVTPQSQGDH